MPTKRHYFRMVLWLPNLLLLVLFSAAALGQVRFDHVEYVIPQTNEKNTHNHWLKGSAVFDKKANLIEFMDEQKVSVLKIPVDRVTSLYDEVKLSFILPVRENTHFLTIQYDEADGTPKSVVIKKARPVLKPIEAELGMIATQEDKCCQWP